MSGPVAVLHNLAPGGAHRRLTEQVRHLGLEVVEVTTTAAEPVTERPILVPLHVRADSSPRLLRPPLRWRDLAQVERAWARMGEVAVSTGAAVIMTNPDRFLKGAVASRVTAVPTLAYVDEPRRIDHEPELRETLSPTTRRLYAPLRRRQARCDSEAVRAATVVATNSRYSRSRIAAAYARQAVVVPCGVPSSFLDVDPCDRPSHLLTVGSAIPTKGHELVLRAAAASGLRLPVVLVTDREGPEVHRLSAVAAEVGTVLEVRTRVPDTELRTLYRTALATLYLAQAEPLGLVSLEAQAAGCPVVVSDEGGLPETVEEGRSGFVVPRDPSAAAEALRRLAADGVRPAMSRAAQERMRGATWRDAAVELRTALLGMLDATDLRRDSRAGTA